jgi:SAM-dependent methyltransferase
MIFINKNWQATKFVIIGNEIKPSNQVGIKSKRMANYIANFYSKVIPKYANGLLLDLGCGQAPLLDFYSKYVEKVICADWKNSIHDQSIVDVFCDLNEPLDFATDTFDTVILSDVLNHLKDPELALREIHRILKPNGVLLFNTPFLYNLNEEPYDFGRYSTHKFEFWAAKYNFKTIQIETFGGINDVLEHFGLRVIYKLPAGKILGRFIYKMRSIILKNNYNTNKSTDSPYGYGVIMVK